MARVREIGQLVETMLRDAKQRLPPVDVDRIARANGAVVRYAELTPDLSGLLQKIDDTVVIGVNSAHSDTRKRFTVAHELGHLLLHNSTTHVDRTFVERRRDSTSSMAVDPREIQANKFAAELLMPRSWIRRDVANRRIDPDHDAIIHELAQKYGVSEQAMSFRLTNLGLVAL